MGRSVPGPEAGLPMDRCFPGFGVRPMPLPETPTGPLQMGHGALRASVSPLLRPVQLQDVSLQRTTYLRFRARSPAIRMCPYRGLGVLRGILE